MKQIIVKLQKGYYGKFRRLKLLVDGFEVGSLRQGEQQTLNVSKDAKNLEGKMDWGKTEAIKISDLSDKDIIVFEPYLSANPFRNVGLAKIPIKISIQKE